MGIVIGSIVLVKHSSPHKSPGGKIRQGGRQTVGDMRYAVDLRHPLQAPCGGDGFELKGYEKTTTQSSRPWESRRDFQRVWEAGFMGLHAFHTLSFPWPAFC